LTLGSAAEYTGYSIDEGETVPVPAILQNPKLQASLAIFLFVIAWWFGNGALFMSEFGGGITASFIFPIGGLFGGRVTKSVIQRTKVRWS
jgi:hypothetical protein